jgi:hypothetical protein
VNGAEALAQDLNRGADRIRGDRDAYRDIRKQEREVAELERKKKEETFKRDELMVIAVARQQLKDLDVEFYEKRERIGDVLTEVTSVTDVLRVFVKRPVVRWWHRVLGIKDVKCRYTFVSFEQGPGQHDVRADILTAKDMKHSDPMYCKVAYHVNDTHCLDLVVSVELLSQITQGGTLLLGSTDDDVAERLRLFGSRHQSVNFSRFDTILGREIVSNTCLVAYALHKRYQQKTILCPFPAGPLQDKYWTPTAIVTERLSLTRYLILNSMRLFLILAVIIASVVLWYKLPSVVTLKEWQYLTHVSETLELWKRAFAGDLQLESQSQMLQLWGSLPTLLVILLLIILSLCLLTSILTVTAGYHK